MFSGFCAPRVSERRGYPWFWRVLSWLSSGGEYGGESGVFSGFQVYTLLFFRSLPNSLSRFLVLLYTHIRSKVLGRRPSIVANFSEIRKILGSLPFSGVIRIVRFTRSISLHLRLKASPHLAPVSLRSCRNVAICLLHPVMRSSISLSVGMKGSFSMGLYLGFFHVKSCILRKSE